MNTLIIIVVIAMLLFLISFLSDDVSVKRSVVDIHIVDELLPQTQCGDCGFPGCRPYADAIVKHEVDINRCLPGGDDTIQALSELLGKEIKPLYKNNEKNRQKSVAVIDEAVCIGCVKCINACPMDAIIGAPKQMHSVINQYCTGCDLCVSPCPVDCIRMVPAL